LEHSQTFAQIRRHHSAGSPHPPAGVIHIAACIGMHVRFCKTGRSADSDLLEVV
jgi:hypothetical protein